jgi:hypothetical protein
MMKMTAPLKAVAACGVAGAVAIPLAVHFGADKGSVAISGIGALAQVVVAVLLYFLTRDQLLHAKSEAAYRKVEQRIAKRERQFADMNRVQAAYGNAKTGIGKTRCDEGQVERLDRLRDDVRLYFQQPASQNFNKMVDAAKGALAIGVDKPGYVEKIAVFDSCAKQVYENIKDQIETFREKIEADEAVLSAL